MIGNVARATGLTCRGQIDASLTRGALYKYASHWVAIAPSRRDLGRVGRARDWHDCAADPGARPWSDDYANVVGAFR